MSKSVRVSDYTYRQLTELRENGLESLTNTLSVAVDRFYRAEMPKEETMYRGNDCSDEFETARRRVESEPRLEQYASLILDDWDEGAEHWQWVATASIDEIVEWAETIDGEEHLAR